MSMAKLKGSANMKKDIDAAIGRWQALHGNRLNCDPESIVGWSYKLTDEQKVALIKKQIQIECASIGAHRNFLNR